MWLSASYFNRATNFESLSKFGRKRKHKIDPDAAQHLPNKKRRMVSADEKRGKKENSKSRKSSSFQKHKKRYGRRKQQPRTTREKLSAAH